MLAWLGTEDPLPDPARAWQVPNGLLAASAQLSVARLLEAYRRGIFPWYTSGQPVLWWSPDPRMVLHLPELRVSRSLRKTLRTAQREARWRVTLDVGFDRVMRECAAPRAGQDGTWITEDIRAGYGALHRLGFAHSVEVWNDERLVGGLYGVSIGRMFYGESMFAREPDASKAALVALARMLEAHDFSVIDCQQSTRHLASLGAREIPRAAFLERVDELVRQPAPDWRTMRIALPHA
ncbi:MAG: leucyl/phenylalanyl-tRNA--protein transferase [Burkholderiaceae bacterium]|nr:leucyl/phenylalanyl-tRNA--protein transferase [Burkholderiaceae bacterium]